MNFVRNNIYKAEQLTFRESVNGDAPDVLRICASIGGLQETWVEKVQRHLEAKYRMNPASSTRMIYVAVDQGAVVGFISGHLLNELSYGGQIDGVVIAGAYQRLGIASELLWIMMGWFRERNEFRIKANVSNLRAALRYFYYCHKAENLDDHTVFWNDIRSVFSK